jgi:hypothetical protein
LTQAGADGVPISTFEVSLPVEQALSVLPVAMFAPEL